MLHKICSGDNDVSIYEQLRVSPYPISDKPIALSEYVCFT